MIKRRTLSLILSLIGVGGVGATSWLAVRCSKKAETAEGKKGKILAYAPAIGAGVATAGCILGSHHVSTKEIAALTATCGYLTANREKIQKVVKEKFGDEKLQEVNQAVAQEEMKEAKDFKKKKPLIGQTIEETGYGDVLFTELYLGRKFRSSVEHVEKAIKELNREFHYGNYVSMNDFYDYLGIETTLAGENFGWPANDDFYDYNLETPIEMELIKGEDDGGEVMYAIDIHYGFFPMEGWMEV